MKVVAFLPVKGTSSRIKSKNLKLIDGKPLFIHTLEKLIECDFIDEVYLDSESEEVFGAASYLDFIKMKRDPSLATNKTDGHMLFFNEAKKVEADIYIQILCTSPFIKKETIKKGIEILINKKEYDSVVLVRKEKLYLWDKKGPKYNLEKIPNSFDLEDTIIETMGLYITRKHVALDYKRRIGKNPYLLEAEAIEAIDINYPEDFKLAEYVMSGLREEEVKKLRSLSNFFTSAILSDVMDDLNINGFIKGFSLNIENKKIFGRAKTLKLRKLKNDEEFIGIYDAMNIYKTIVQNDIIVVENEEKDYAFFGNLNANLAIKNGASGCIVDGKTRDFSDVKSLDFPVFSKGYCSKDVRKRATLESINKPIKIEGVQIKPGDLIFGDIEGIIVIPKKFENIILKKAIERIKNEKGILNNILEDFSIVEIIDKNGFF
ncbi:Regulator of RNase E activity RraA [Marinitoga hydrogenitolerans DSM 16785]|uniref:Regulator of RNase E activity RraA n=1 Tax=Marinitoga hydrogenitolerans (strain DSM 16785 / JCM 12826 / AT1271) TaxID=1122195 RepID=A0A1M4ZXM7_MARH1|nr:cytidyltransferase [Marinitoga hydrogenitolerans]SHF22607.1 Regulator of RNase E activity RraA [Marinitoga hydrogenitolerans DSM 16785]